MASLDCTNTDISGIGVRSATYAQNLLSFVPAAIALFNDGKISNSEREFIKDQSTNILLTAFGLLLSAIIQAKSVQGLDNYHLALVLNLSWLNNTNTFIYLVLALHRRIWNSSLGEWGWGAVVPRLFPQSSKGTTAHKSTPEDVEMADISPQQTTDQTAQGEPEPLLDSTIWIGSLHLSLMGGVGVWLWSNPTNFGSSPSCPPNATISVLSRTLSMASPGLRVLSLIFYTAVLIPIVNLVLPTALILIPYLLRLLGKSSDAKKREWVAVCCVALGLFLLFSINVIFIIDTELSILRNESRQGGQDTIWTLGQTLALLLLVVPIRGLIRYLLTTTSLVLPFVRETDWGRAARGFRNYDARVPWSEVQRWRWLMGDTPVKADSRWLYYARINHQPDVERFLCENGADWDLVVHAARQGEAEIVRSFFTRDMDVNHLVNCAIENGNLEIVRFLVENGADVKSRDGFLLYLAAASGQLEIMRFLVESGADLKSRDGFLWHTAVRPGQLKIVRFLVKYGADVKSQDSFLLHIAAGSGQLEIVRFLVENGADVESQGGLLLRIAAESGQLEIMRFLVENGADIKRSDSRSLHAAVKSGQLEIVHFLIEKGADINGQDNRNRTPLDVAVKERKREIVSFLRNNGGVQTPTRISEILAATCLKLYSYFTSHR